MELLSPFANCYDIKYRFIYMQIKKILNTKQLLNIKTKNNLNKIFSRFYDGNLSIEEKYVFNLIENATLKDHLSIKKLIKYIIEMN